MKYSESDAKRKAKMVVDQVGTKILAAVAGTTVDPAFLAGKIGVEAGVRGGRIVETATRFEAGVFEDLKSLRDNGFCFVGGKKLKQYSGVTQAQIKDASDAALKALATSYGLSQIVGWHMINNLKGSVSDLRDPDKNLIYTIQLMKIVAGSYLSKKDYEACLRIWNTGKAKGATYDPNYVHNALLVMRFAAPLLKDLKSSSGSGGQVSGVSLMDKIGATDFEPDADDLTDHVDEDAKTDQAASNDQQSGDQGTGDAPKVADKIIIGAGDPDAGKEPPKNKPEDVTMTAPAPQNLWQKISGKWTALGLGVPTAAGVFGMAQSAWQDGHIDWKEALQIFVTVLVAIMPYVAGVLVIFMVCHTANQLMIQHSFNKRMEINGNPDLNNIKIKQNLEQTQPAALMSGAKAPWLQIGGWKIL